jgi:hypothetical protein
VCCVVSQAPHLQSKEVLDQNGSRGVLGSARIVAAASIDHVSGLVLSRGGGGTGEEGETWGWMLSWLAGGKDVILRVNVLMQTILAPVVYQLASDSQRLPLPGVQFRTLMGLSPAYVKIATDQKDDLALMVMSHEEFEVRGCCPSPVWVHCFGMRHQGTWCAALAAGDDTRWIGFGRGWKVVGSVSAWAACG